jgi:hypothetical protein
MKFNAVICGVIVTIVSISTAWADPPCRPFGYRSPLMPAPWGTHANGWFDAQAVAAEADQFVIYRQEWLADGTTLGPYGSYHLQRIIQRLRGVPFPVVIEVDQRGDKINLARQAFIVNQLLAAGIPDAQARVVVGYPRAEGLFGDEAARIFLQTYSGSRGGAGGVGSGGTSGGGLGMPSSGFMGGFRGY